MSSPATASRHPGCGGPCPGRPGRADGAPPAGRAAAHRARARGVRAASASARDRSRSGRRCPRSGPPHASPSSPRARACPALGRAPEPSGRRIPPWSGTSIGTNGRPVPVHAAWSGPPGGAASMTSMSRAASSGASRRIVCSAPHTAVLYATLQHAWALSRHAASAGSSSRRCLALVRVFGRRRVRRRDPAEQHPEQQRDAEILEDRLDEPLARERRRARCRSPGRTRRPPDRDSCATRASRRPPTRPSRRGRGTADDAGADPHVEQDVVRRHLEWLERERSGQLRSLAEPPAEHRVLLDQVAGLRSRGVRGASDGRGLPFARERAIEARDEDRRLAGERRRQHDREHAEPDETEHDEAATPSA